MTAPPLRYRWHKFTLPRLFILQLCKKALVKKRHPAAELKDISCLASFDFFPPCMGAGLPAGRLSAGSYPQIKGRRQKDGGHWLLPHQAASHNTGWINLQQLLPGVHFSTFSLSISLFIHPLSTTISIFTSTSIYTLCPLSHFHLMSTYSLRQSAMPHLRSG